MFVAVVFVIEGESRAHFAIYFFMTTKLKLSIIWLVYVGSSRQP